MPEITAKTPAPPPPPKSRSNPQREAAATTKRGVRPTTWLRVIISLLLIWHLTAVALAPMSLPPSSRLIVDITQQPPMQWYLDALYLNHGYHFFAPDPGDGRLVRYEVFDERGGTIAQGEFPNRKEHWPRLLYHRYFMLADQAGAGLGGDDEQQRQQWQRTFLEAYARHLLRMHDGESVRLRWIVHYQLPPNLAAEGRKINDPESYRLLMEVTQRRSDLKLEATTKSSDVRGSERRDTAGRWMGVPR